MILRTVLILTLYYSSYVNAQEFQPPPIPPVVPAIEPLPVIINNNDKPTGAAMVQNRLELGAWLLTKGTGTYPQNHDTEYEGYDGWYNNLARPDLGAIDRPLLRRGPASYEDGSYEPSGGNRPNPLSLSDQLLAGEVGSMSQTGKNALLVFFGQQVVEEVLDAQRPACPPEYFNIPIPEGHRYRNETKLTVLPFLRTRYDMRTGYSPNNPRQQLNEITPYLDGGLVYGTTKGWSDYLRRYENGTVDPNGRLASSYDGLFPEYNTARMPMANPPPPINHSTFVHQHELLNVSRFFRLGNPRGNENTFLLTFGILWFRWHNYIADSIKAQQPDWSGEKIFNEARKWVIATQQHLVVNQWLQEWLGQDLPAYRGYDPSVDPQIDQFFQSVAMRFGHTLVVPGVYLRDYGRNGCGYEFPQWPNKAVRTCNAFWRPQDAILTKYNATHFMDIDRLLMGMSVQMSEREDNLIVEDLRGNVFGPLEFSRRDLMALNIQRARDHGLPDYNSIRQAYNLSKIEDVEHFVNVDEETKQKFLKIYEIDKDIKNWDKVDPWIGGIFETSTNPGELFRAIIGDQFRRIRDGDRFWFENLNNNLFTKEEIIRIKKLNIYDMIMAVTQMDANDIPRNPFRVPYQASEMHTNCTSKLITSNCTNNKQCLHLPPLYAERLQEDCTLAGTYNYFRNSEASFILSFAAISLFILCVTGAVWWLSRKQTHARMIESRRIEDAVRETFRKEKIAHVPYPVKEWTGFKKPLNTIVVVLDSTQKQIQVNTQKGTLLRAIEVGGTSNNIELYIATDNLHVMLKMEHEYSLVLKFDSDYLCNNFITALERFTDETGITRERINMALTPMLKQAVTKADRQKQLDMFFRVVFAQAFKIKHNDDEIQKVDSKAAKEIIYTELTINEFADALAMKPQSEFVRRIFNLIDKDKNHFVSFREFLDLLFIFAKGSGREKAKLLFDMYDIDGTDFLTEEDFKNMIKSLMGAVHVNVNQEDLNKTIKTIKQDIKLKNKGMNFEEFFKIFKEDIEKVGNVNIEFANACQNKSKNRQSYLEEARDTIEGLYQDPSELRNRVGGADVASNTKRIDEEQERIIDLQPNIDTPPSFYLSMSRYIQTNMRVIFWLALYTFVLLAIFAERAYFYSVEREHSGLRRIAGYGVTVTRGAASAMMFTYSSLLVTMCRNLITWLRETFLNNLIPFDSMIMIHKYIACWALVFTIMHIIGHAFNFYHISTQTADDLTCLFRNYFHATHELPKFHYWCWQTMTGFTGIVLTLIGTWIYVCAIPCMSRNMFWRGHALYPFFFVFMILHGTGRLIQEPFFPNFFICPLIMFIIDSLITASRKKIEIRVLSAELLPSAVTKLEFKRPNNFEYKSGQWVRIACLGLNPSEFHPFTLSSSPNESNLTVHIRSVGPWTTAIREIYDTNQIHEDALSKIHLDGPYGEGHQDWYRYDVSVLVGGGIGVTPFASILKDIVFRANIAHKAKCTKVYFVWVARTQKQFEWLVDIIREVEMSDVTQAVSVHLFVTQFYHKYDLRTTLLYICERHFQRVSGKSLFTGLKAVTHFGRPKFSQFFSSLKQLHPEARNIGVFSCGPPPLTISVEKACVQINKGSDSAPTFHHYYKNF